MAATTIATAAMLNAGAQARISTAAKPSSSSNHHHVNPKPISLLSLRTLLHKPKRLSAADPSSLAGTAAAGAFFSAMAAADPAFAAQKIADVAGAATVGDDNRVFALLLPIVPALAWVLFNILQPGLNQLNRMRSSKGVMVGLGLGLTAAQFIGPDAVFAAAGEVAEVAGGTDDKRGLLLLIVVTPALLWVAYNILQPALNQINRMRSNQ